MDKKQLAKWVIEKPNPFTTCPNPYDCHPNYRPQHLNKGSSHVNQPLHKKVEIRLPTITSPRPCCKQEIYAPSRIFFPKKSFGKGKGNGQSNQFNYSIKK